VLLEVGVARREVSSLMGLPRHVLQQVRLFVAECAELGLEVSHAPSRLDFLLYTQAVPLRRVWDGGRYHRQALDAGVEDGPLNAARAIVIGGALPQPLALHDSFVEGALCPGE
jgi:hypothetical protein